MDSSTVIGILIGVIIIGIMVWSTPNEEESKRYKNNEMTLEERKKRETKNVIFFTMQYIFSLPRNIDYTINYISIFVFYWLFCIIIILLNTKQILYLLFCCVKYCKVTFFMI